MPRVRWDQAAHLARYIVVIGCIVLLIYAVDDSRLLQTTEQPAAETSDTTTLLPEARSTSIDRSSKEP